MPPEKSTRRLGRGLDALFGANAAGATAATGNPGLRQLPVRQIQSNPFQPRKDFSEQELHELQESLRVSGLIQPITVRPAPGSEGYQLIAGERRLRAASALGWKEIPAVIKDIDDRELLTLALVENLQRLDLNPVEEAEGYERLIREFGYTQQTVADMVGKDRSTVANTLRILNLPASVRELVQGGKMTAGQARPLLALQDEERMKLLANEIVREGLSAREVERRTRMATSGAATTSAATSSRQHDSRKRPAELTSIEQVLRKHLQTDVGITMKNASRGTVSIEFYSADDLERLIERMGVPNIPQ